MIVQEAFIIHTGGRGLVNVTQNVQDIVTKSAVVVGVCHLFIHHTSASLTITEKHDPDVLADLERFMQHVVPDGDPLFRHYAEGVDDMPSHVRSVLTQTSLEVPISDQKLELGTWQGIFLWEHRLQPHERKVTVTVTGISGDS